MHFHSALTSGSRSRSALARSIVASCLHLAAGVMPFLNHRRILRNNVKRLQSVPALSFPEVWRYKVFNIQERLFGSRYMCGRYWPSRRHSLRRLGQALKRTAIRRFAMSRYFFRWSLIEGQELADDDAARRHAALLAEAAAKFNDHPS